MTAAEIIKLIKKLPPEEKAEVIAFLMNKEEEAGRVEEAAIKGGIRFVADEEFEQLAPKIFAENRELLRRLAQ